MPKGKNTSIWFSAELCEAIEASGRKPVELIWRGLETLDHGLAPETLGQLAVLNERRRDCKHPGARVHKGLCGACGTYVAAR